MKLIAEEVDQSKKIVDIKTGSGRNYIKKKSPKNPVATQRSSEIIQ
ncbi:hypothetical protein ATK78_0581 [Pedobacter metabolipauper]|uniref:Uncharacterized protein n=1 Tax=Pedobacter metabolipauper TaxID=425513 RepID=A0A4R6T0B3_9SPHI|nr:hypothetical protein ATK78_0581 [Pedobacter metabolipauper]